MKVFIKAERKRNRDFVFTLAALVFILFVHGAVPFFSVPTFLQAIWTTGFSLSLSNDPYLAIYANDIGYPKPAAIAFGLSGALPMSFLLRLGMSPADAYSSIVALWLMVAFFACRSICAGFKIGKPNSTILALLWMTQPVIWNHVAYSMLSVGIALLPLYFYAALRLFVFIDLTRKALIVTVVLYSGSCLISVFMDGYTFMMFAVGSSVLGAWSMLRAGSSHRYLFGFAYPLHLLSFGVAYLLYSSYVGAGQYQPVSMDFFRGWGADILFFVLPTKGVYWLWDALGLSVVRSEVDFFGDASVWITTFILPVFVLGVGAWVFSRKIGSLLYVAMFLVLFGGYMSLGPSLKFNSMKLGFVGQTMPAEYALAPTGASMISENLPGFNSMRASYRWIALGVFGIWLVVALGFAYRRNSRYDRVFIAAVLLVVFSGMPDMAEKWVEYKKNRLSFSQIDRDLIGALRLDVKKDEKVIFLPFRNDFIATYAAPAAGFKAYNIGGDKNLAAAMRYWPEALNVLSVGEVDNVTLVAALKLLVDRDADVAIFPYVDFQHFSSWPIESIYKGRLHWALNYFKGIEILEVQEREHYFSVRLGGDSERAISDAGGFVNFLCANVYPVSMDNENCAAPFFLKSGWYALERRHVWSRSEASIRIYTPDSCANQSCRVSLRLSAYGATADKPKYVHFDWADSKGDVSRIPSLSFSDGAPQSITFRLPSGFKFKDLNVIAPEAVSPKNAGASIDARVLGVSLHYIDVGH